MDTEQKKRAIQGPIIIAGANALRSLDAPVRYPLLLSRYEVGQTSLQSAVKLAGYSSFLVTIEHIIGVLIIVPFIMFRRGINHLLDVVKQFDTKDRIAMVMVSVGSGFGLYFFLIAFAMGNPSVAILLQKSQPLITVVAAMYFLKERPIKEFYILAAISLAAIVLIIYDDITKPEVYEHMAALASILAATFWGLNTVFGKRLSDKVDYWDLTALRYVGASIILIVFGLLTSAFTSDNFEVLGTKFNTFAPTIPGWSAPWQLDIEMHGITALCYSAVVTGGIIGLALYYKGLKSSKASVCGFAELAFPLLAIFVNYVFLGWELSAAQLIGATILLVSTTAFSVINARQFEHEASVKETTK